MRKAELLRQSALVALGLVSSCALGQTGAISYPTRPVTTVVAIASGGPIDFEARLYATKMTELTGQPFVLDYKPGAGGAIGSAYVAKAAPDGHVLLVASAALTVAPAFYKNLPYDTVKDFAPVSLMSKRYSVLVVHPSFPARNFVDYVAYARANPGKINFGTSGVGSISHLSAAWMHNATNTRVTFLPYKGNTPLTQDLIAGRLDVSTANLLGVAPLVKAGKVRVVAFMSNVRSSLLPGVVPIAEQGIPDFDHVNWLGYVAPGATPTAIVNKLGEAFARVARMPDVVTTLETAGGALVGSTSGEFRQVINTEIARWRRVVEENGIKPEE